MSWDSTTEALPFKCHGSELKGYTLNISLQEGVWKFDILYQNPTLLINYLLIMIGFLVLLVYCFQLTIKATSWFLKLMLFNWDLWGGEGGGVNNFATLCKYI